LRELSLLEYTYEGFFDYIVEAEHIKVLGHHFTGRKIEGLTIKDSRGGTSFSYETENPLVKQNFTKCHELGHYLLKHQGNFFTEISENQTSPYEVEANYFSACLLMPDIVLLSKIYYQKISYQGLITSLMVSSEALMIRLSDLLTNLTGDNRSQVQVAVQLYKTGNSSAIIECFSRVNDMIIKEYRSFEPTPKDKLSYILEQKYFVTDKEVKELEKAEFRQSVTSSHVGTWAYFNKGKTIYYAWNKEKLNDEQALKMAKTKYYLQ
ncbi:ImmA/IrrE family metallo-endopeptidase, partial [Streptococcus dysgalactiae]|uniref:ImmA/IrrE family metallo-endopeptidase n=1 Tax=Streptococcus dysgalactiae TaxID=1334 RepID=UPI0018684C89